METLNRFLDFLIPYGFHSYYIMFAILLGCGLGFPMPEDIILISGGILASHGICDFVVVNIVCLAGVLIGDSFVFSLGHRLGNSIKSTWLYRKVFNEKRNETVQHVFNKYGDKVIFAARFMPGLRMPIFMTAGIYKVPAWKFFMLDGFAALISVPLWIYVGYLFGSNMEQLEIMIRKMQMGMYAVLFAVILFFTLMYWLKKKFLTVR